MIPLIAVCLATAQVIVDREVHVSSAHAGLKMGETVIAADPNDSQRLVGAAIAWLDGAGRRAVVAYVSEDGGLSWRPSLTTASRFYDTSDETVAFSHDGMVYLAALARVSRDAPRPEMVVYRSPNGGRDWTLESQTAPASSIDRPFIAVVERSPHDTLCIGAFTSIMLTSGTTTTGPAMLRSDNEGKTLELMDSQPSTPPAIGFASGNLAVLSSGRSVTVWNEITDRGALDDFETSWGSYRVLEGLRGVVRATHGRDCWRLETSTVVAPHVQPFMPFEGWGPSIAADPGSPRFKDRLYVVWPDRSSRRSRILSSFSADEGKTWSSPRTVDDAPAPSSRQAQPSNFMPMVAVNADGIVGVMWYDRRDDPSNLGWSIRFAASLDGGGTWTSSVRVSSQPNVFDEHGFLSTSSPASGVTIELDDRQFYAADTVGMTAAADGSFHPFWVDNRTGVPQVWTARIRVRPRRP